MELVKRALGCGPVVMVAPLINEGCFGIALRQCDEDLSSTTRIGSAAATVRRQIVRVLSPGADGQSDYG